MDPTFTLSHSTVDSVPGSEPPDRFRASARALVQAVLIAFMPLGGLVTGRPATPAMRNKADGRHLPWLQ